MIRWLEPGRGYAFEGGGTQRLRAQELPHDGDAPAGTHTLLIWTEHFDSTDVHMQRTVFDEALADIGNRLVPRFGGRITEWFVEP